MKKGFGKWHRVRRLNTICSSWPQTIFVVSDVKVAPKKVVSHPLLEEGNERAWAIRARNLSRGQREQSRSFMKGGRRRVMGTLGSFPKSI